MPAQIKRVDGNSTKRLYTKPLPPFRQASTVQWANGILQSTITAAKKLMEAICQMAPAQLPIQVRTLPIWEKAPHQEQGRIGFHDDYLVGAHFKWNSDCGRFWNRRERTFRALSRLRFNDGEMPWGKDTVYQNGRIDGLQMLACCANHSLSTLSISHNYREGGGRLQHAPLARRSPFP